MKIVIVGPAYPFRGGIAHFGGCLFKEFERKGHQTVIINFASQYPALIFPGKSQYEENSYFSGIPSKRILTPYNPFSYPKTLKAILAESPDLVLFNYFIPFLIPAYAYLLKRLSKRKVFTLLLTHNIVAHEKWFLAASLTARMLKAADKIMTLSTAVYDEALHIVPKDSVIKAFHPLYDFYNRKLYTKSEARIQLGLQDKRVILFFGYIKPYKGVETLLLSFPLIKKAFPNAVLLIVGEIYGDKSLYMRLIEQSAFKADIILKDEYTSNDSVELYFKASDVLALPYRTATQSGVVQIAYSMNIGAVVTPVGGLPEMIINGKTGIVSKSVDEHSFAQAVIDYLSLDADKLTKNIKDFKKELSWEKLVNLIEDDLH